MPQFLQPRESSRDRRTALALQLMQLSQQQQATGARDDNDQLAHAIALLGLQQQGKNVAAEQAFRESQLAQTGKYEDARTGIMQSEADTNAKRYFDEVQARTDALRQHDKEFQMNLENGFVSDLMRDPTIAPAQKQAIVQGHLARFPELAQNAQNYTEQIGRQDIPAAQQAWKALEGMPEKNADANWPAMLALHPGFNYMTGSDYPQSTTPPPPSALPLPQNIPADMMSQVSAAQQQQAALQGTQAAYVQQLQDQQTRQQVLDYVDSIVPPQAQVKNGQYQIVYGSGKTVPFSRFNSPTP